MALVIYCIAAILVVIPGAAFVIVTIASRREDAAWSLCGPPRSRLEAAARRIVDFHSELDHMPLSKAQVMALRDTAALIGSQPAAATGASRSEAGYGTEWPSA